MGHGNRYRAELKCVSLSPNIVKKRPGWYQQKLEQSSSADGDLLYFNVGVTNIPIQYYAVLSRNSSCLIKIRCLLLFYFSYFILLRQPHYTQIIYKYLVE